MLGVPFKITPVDFLFTWGGGITNRVGRWPKKKEKPTPSCLGGFGTDVAGFGLCCRYFLASYFWGETNSPAAGMAPCVASVHAGDYVGRLSCTRMKDSK